MRTDMRPDEGIVLEVGGVEFHLLFTFAAIDELQTEYNAPLQEIVRKMTDDMTMYSAAGHILHALIASDLFNNGEPEANAPTYDQIMHVLDKNKATAVISAVLRAYGLDMPEPDEDGDEDDEEPDKINIARLLMIGRTELGMSETEFWKTTPRKFFKLFEEYAQWKGGGKKEGGGIDDLP